MTVSSENRAQFEIMGSAGLRADMITGKLYQKCRYAEPSPRMVKRAGYDQRTSRDFAILVDDFAYRRGCDRRLCSGVAGP
jgi:hypothetical protein